jgi:enhancing lycopene biosynthesis protein 2
MPKVGIMLSGCGVFDGTEIYEAAYTVLALEAEGADVLFIAPDVEQMHVIDHAAGQPAEGEKRSVAVEAARIARGPVKDAAKVEASHLDALVFPGGFGAAKNLSNFAVKGPSCTVQKDVERLIKDMYMAGKPLGFMCIAPVIAAKVLGNGVKLTIGEDPQVAEAINAMAATHVEKPVDEICVDETQKVVSAPAYMYGAARRPEIFAGIQKLAKEVVKMCGG